MSEVLAGGDVGRPFLFCRVGPFLLITNCPFFYFCHQFMNADVHTTFFAEFDSKSQPRLGA